MMAQPHCYLSEQLRRGLHQIECHAVTAVTAPVGYGKTTALRWWQQQPELRAPGSAVIWHTVLSQDEDGFWVGLCRAVQTVYPALAQQLRTGGFPHTSQAREAVRLALTQLPDDTYYIADGLHMTCPRVRDLLWSCAEQLPDGLHLILISRNPIWEEQRLQAYGTRLLRLTVEDFRLRRQELAPFAARYGVTLSRADSARLWGLSEGWAALLSWNLSVYHDRQIWLTAEDHADLALEDVLLEDCPARRRAFAACLSICEEFSAALAQQLWQGDDTEELLDALTHDNAFVTVHQGCYRFHPMLRLCARHAFCLLPQEQRQVYFRRLAGWQVQQGQYRCAEQSYVRGQDWDSLLETIAADGGRQLHAGHRTEFLHWMSMCPPEVFARHPEAMLACMVQLFAYGSKFSLQRLRSRFLAACDALPPDLRRERLLGEYELTEMLLAFDRPAAMLPHLRRAARLLRRPSDLIGTDSLWTLSAPSIFTLYHRTAGQANAETELLREAMPYFVKVCDGGGSGAEEVMEAELLFERGMSGQTHIRCAQAGELARRAGQHSIVLAADFLAMRMALLTGDLDRIRVLLRRQQDALRTGAPAALHGTLDLCAAFVYTLAGCCAEIPDWLRRAEEPQPRVLAPALPAQQTVYGQVLLAQGDWPHVIAYAETRGPQPYVMEEIYRRLQLCAAYEAMHCMEQAAEQLRAAGALAAPDELVMPFVWYSGHIAGAMQRGAGLPMPMLAHIRALSEQFRQGCRRMAQQAGAIPAEGCLTARETEIAALAARRMGNREIAERLGISEGTVKNRLKTVFSKLNIVGEGKNKRAQLEQRWNTSGYIVQNQPETKDMNDISH